jgi:hypothetical protein
LTKTTAAVTDGKELLNHRKLSPELDIGWTICLSSGTSPNNLSQPWSLESSTPHYRSGVHGVADVFPVCATAAAIIPM